MVSGLLRMRSFLQEIESETGFDYVSFRENKYRLFYSGTYKGEKEGCKLSHDVPMKWRLKQFTTPYSNFGEFLTQLAQIPLRFVSAIFTIHIDLLVASIYTFRLGWHLVSLNLYEAYNDIKKTTLFLSHIFYIAFSMPIDPLIVVACFVPRLIMSVKPLIKEIHQHLTVYIPAAFSDIFEDFPRDIEHSKNIMRRADKSCTKIAETPFVFGVKYLENSVIEDGKIIRKSHYFPGWKIDGLRCSFFHECNKCSQITNKRNDDYEFFKEERIRKRDEDYNYPVTDVYDQELLAPVI